MNKPEITKIQPTFTQYIGGYEFVCNTIRENVIRKNIRSYTSNPTYLCLSQENYACILAKEIANQGSLSSDYYPVKFMDKEIIILPGHEIIELAGGVETIAGIYAENSSPETIENIMNSIRRQVYNYLYDPHRQTIPKYLVMSKEVTINIQSYAQKKHLSVTRLLGELVTANLTIAIYHGDSNQLPLVVSDARTEYIRSWK